MPCVGRRAADTGSSAFADDDGRDAEKGADPAYMSAMLSRIPLRRQASAEQVAETVIYLASPAAAAVTGQVLVLDGGLTVA